MNWDSENPWLTTVLLDRSVGIAPHRPQLFAGTLGGSRALVGRPQHRLQTVFVLARKAPGFDEILKPLSFREASAAEDIELGGSIMDITWQSVGRTYTPDDFARLRAGRILLNGPPPIMDKDHAVSPDQMHDLMLESHIRGTNAPVSVEHCILQVTYRTVGNDPEKFLRLARLASIYFLKAGGAVERILNLTLGPIKDRYVHVQFRGRRRKVASNVEPTVIELEGDCPLE